MKPRSLPDLVPILQAKYRPDLDLFVVGPTQAYPRGSRYLTIKELGLKDHEHYGFWGLFIVLNNWVSGPSGYLRRVILQCRPFVSTNVMVSYSVKIPVTSYVAQPHIRMILEII